MTLIAYSDPPRPLIGALKILKYDIATLEELAIPVRPDSELMAGLLRTPHRVLVTMDTGIPSQAYLYRYAQAGLTVVLLRWKTRTPRDLQEMAVAILTHGSAWEALAAREPGIISVSRSGWRHRAWSRIPATIEESARSRFGEPHPGPDHEP